jgi:anti-anti-sigma factor
MRLPLAAFWNTEEVKEHMETAIVTFAGEYDIAAKERLRADLNRFVDVSNVILDFSAVTFVDSTAIAELVRLHRLRAENLYERETIVVGAPSLRRLFGLLQLNKIFEIVDVLEDAHCPDPDTVTRHNATPGHGGPGEGGGSGAAG